MEFEVIPHSFEVLATILFAFAILHTFLASSFRAFACRFREGSVGENFFQLIGEVEVVFGFWAMILIALMAFLLTPSRAVQHADSLNYTEPLFVFVIMALAATRPIVGFATLLLNSFGQGLHSIARLPREAAVFVTVLVLGPLLGSFITEPAAMTVTALILKHRFYDRGVSVRFQYLTLGVLFVNVSIGGVLTPYAAPPVLMVAAKWGLDMSHMWIHYGAKSVLAVLVNAVLATLVLGKELKRLSKLKAVSHAADRRLPYWIIALHLGFLALTVIYAHHPVIFMGVFMLFLGVAHTTQEYQDELRLKDALLVAFFLAGLVVLGSFQSWWLAPLLAKLDAGLLFVGATGLTAITDNAALTYLGAQVPNVSAEFQYALLAGAVAGGGLTVIANAPNPAGFSILQSSFGKNGVSGLKLFLSALVPTLVAMASFWFLRHI